MRTRFVLEVSPMVDEAGGATEGERSGDGAVVVAAVWFGEASCLILKGRSVICVVNSLMRWNDYG